MPTVEDLACRRIRNSLGGAPCPQQNLDGLSNWILGEDRGLVPEEGTAVDWGDSPESSAPERL